MILDMSIRLYRYGGIAALIVMVAMFILCGVIMGSIGDGEKVFFTVVSLSIDLMGLGICLIFFVLILSDHRINKEIMFFTSLVFLNFLLFFFGFIEWYNLDTPDGILIATVCEYADRFLITVVFIVFWSYLLFVTHAKGKFAYCANIIAVALLVAAFANTALDMFTHHLFVIDQDGVYMIGDAWWTASVLIVAMVTMYVFIACKYESNVRYRAVLCSYTVLPLLASALELLVFQVEVIYLAMLLSVMIIYGNFYVGRSEDLVKKDAELIQQRAEILVSQIQPHFLYNALTSIMNIKGTPPETRDAISDFGKHLRGNLDTLRQKGPIPITREMDHVEVFFELAKLTLGDSVELEIDLRHRNFLVPALTLQTLVDGCIKKESFAEGTHLHIKISTEETEDAHIVTIVDDGVCVEKDADEGVIGSDYGIAAVRIRLEELVKGTVELENDGTVGNRVTVTIPKDESKSRSRPTILVE